MATLTRRVGFRLAEDLHKRLEDEAGRLGLKPSDLARVKLAEALTGLQNTTPQDVVAGPVVKG